MAHRRAKLTVFGRRLLEREHIDCHGHSPGIETEIGAVKQGLGPGGGPPPRLPIHRRPAPAPHQLQVDARMLAPLKASPSQPTGKAAKRRRADIGAASKAVSLGMLRLVEQDVAGAGQLERRREPKPMSSTPPDNSAPCPPAQSSSSYVIAHQRDRMMTWVG